MKKWVFVKPWFVMNGSLFGCLDFLLSFFLKTVKLIKHHKPYTNPPLRKRWVRFRFVVSGNSEENL